jgi:hypothetical protein
MIDAALLAYMRDRAADFLTDTCTIEVRAQGQGEFGNPSQSTWTTVASSVACRVITIGSRFQPGAQVVGSREALTDVYRLICPYGTALDKDQRITLSNGDVYQVVDLNVERTSETDTQAVIVRAH